MRRRVLFTTLLVLSLLATSTFAWVYPDGSEDSLYESYGPRAGKLLIHLYTDTHTQWDALMEGEIDITDWPLSKTIYEELKKWPYNETIQVVNYGPEMGLFILDLNSNGNQYLSNPPDPSYLNPVADNNDSIGNWLIKGGDGPANNHNPMSSVYLRRAIAYLIDRPGLIADAAIGTDFGYPMYTTIPPSLKKFLLDVYGDPTIPWAWTYDPAAANATLEEGGFKINPTTGYRYWDLDDDNIEDPDEWVELIFYIRWDHPGRSHIGTVLLTEMAGVKLRVVTPPPSHVFQNVMVEKNFHMHTGGWSLGLDPDHLILWSWDYYWHPGFCYNYCGHNDPDFNAAAEGIMQATNQTEAVMYAMSAQYAQAYNCLSIPLYTDSGNKAFHRTNVGNNPGDTSEGEAWEGVVNQVSYGIDNGYTFMNMHTNETPYDNGMIIDWGFSVPEIKQLNPIYASWLYDWNVLDRIYESLLVRNPYDHGELLPWIAKAFHVSEYNHPIYGDCTKIAFTLRDDILWGDGTPLTMADVHFTFIELWEILSARGIPGPWWCPRIQNLLDFLILDAFNFEVLLNVRSYWRVGWVGGNIILPKHIWKPIAETGDPGAFMPDPDLVGSGPFRFIEYNSVAKYVLLEANPIFHRYTPLAHSIIANPENRYKFEPEQGTDLTLTLENLCLRGSIDNLDINITITYPNGTQELNQHTNLTINSGEKLNITLPIAWEKGMYGFHITFHGHVNPDRQWIIQSSCYGRAYVTIKEDIVGSTYYDDIGLTSYPHKDQLPTPDFKVDIRDIACAAKAFGSYPGHERWDSASDINGDAKIDIRDIATIATKFGW